MGTLVNFADLAELRARTDLERGLAFANVAATRQSVFRSEAEDIYIRTKALLPPSRSRRRGAQASGSEGTGIGHGA